MKFNASILLRDLTQVTKAHQEFLEEMRSYPDQDLTKRPAADSWNALECIAHLVRYGNFYLPEIEKQLQGATWLPGKDFKSGWLGNYFANSMLPKARLNKMKTFKSMNPLRATIDRNELVVFQAQLVKLTVLLALAAQTDLSRVKTAISISPLIRLRLGDTFRVVIYHNERHIRQAERALMRKRPGLSAS